jgi:serine/threonine protein kinase
MSYLHANNVVHYDLKSLNLLVDLDGNIKASSADD